MTRWNPADRRAALEAAKPFIAVLDHHGQMIDQDADPNEAYEKAKRASPSGTVVLDSTMEAGAAGGGDDDVPNPPAGLRGLVDKALRSCEIDVVKRSWSSFDPTSDAGKREVAAARDELRARGQDIYDVLLDDVAGLIHEPKRPGEKRKRGGIAREFDPAWLTGDFLRQNQKMAKVLAGSSAMYDSIGLSLLPHGASFRDPFSTSSDQGPDGTTFCEASTKECRKVCLVNTGQRALESGAFAAGYLFSALIRELPEPFFINLFDRCVKAFADADEASFHRFIRLNVLSDLPWEKLAPGLIEGICDHARRKLLKGRHTMERGLAFYDYTKLPYRSGLKGYYDLTLSFSGSRGMFPAMFDVLDGDRSSAPRMACVFVKREEKLIRSTHGAAPYRAAPGKPLKSGEQWHEWEFLGEPVWNGDLSDVRPLDDPGVKIVGLTYKPPHYKISPETRGKKFGLVPVVPVTQIDRELPTFLLRVRQPDPDAPPIVMATQDPDNRKLILPTWQE